MSSRFSSLFLIFAFFLALGAGTQAQVVISEFVASNSNGLTDESGANEDWIEVANTTGAAVNLLGYYLTDNVNQPRKWSFPSRMLAANGYLVVFASNKDRKPASGNLHTNFKLSNDGEYLALTKDLAGGGVTVLTVFNPYPQQATDVAYGTTVTTTVTPLLANGAAAKTLIPSVGNGGSDLGATWRGATGTEPFDDSAWTAGTTAVGFPNTGVATANLKLRLNSNTSASIVTDSSGAAHHGTNNKTTWMDETTDALGRTRHGAMQFNATDANGTATGDQVVVPTSSSDFASATKTISFWVKTAGNVADGGNVQGSMLYDQRSGTGIAFGLGIYLADDGTLKVQASNGGTLSNSAASTVAVKDDRWHHVAFVLSRNNAEACTFYIDGVAAGSQINSGAWSISYSQQIEIGRSHDPFWRRFNGQLDDFRIYNTALTGPQILQIFDNEDEPVTAGTNVLAAMQGGNPSAFIRIPFNVSDPLAFSGLNLTMRWNDGYVAWLNGTQIASFASPALPLYDSAATQSHSAGAQFVTSVPSPGSLLRAGTNILAIQALNNSAANGVFSALPTLDGVNTTISSGGYLLTATPGASNGAAKTNLGPFVRNVTKNPNPRPTGTAASPALTITATVTPSLRPLAAVQLNYAIMYPVPPPPPETSVNMTLTATPNVYTANVPTNSLKAGQMLRWRVVATDNTGIAGTAPEYADPIDNEQYYGTVAVDSTIETSLPVLYWFTPNSTAADNATGTRNSFFYKAPGDTGAGRFYDNVEINIHGQSSAGFVKKSYDLDFNKDNRFEWNIAGKRVKDVNLLTNWGDKSKTHNQMTHEALATIGSVHHWCYQVRVQQVTPANAATPANHFWSIADMMEDGDEDFMERNGRDPEGALYKIYDSLSNTDSGEKKTRRYEDKSDYQALISGLDVSLPLNMRRRFAYDNLDLPQCVSYFVGLALAGSQDHGHKNFYVYRDSIGTREWSLLPWDVDLTWGRNWLDASGYFTDTIFTNNDLDMYNSAQQGKGENRLYSLLVGNSDVGRVPAGEFRNMVLRRLRTVMDGYFSAPTVLENRFAALANLLDPPAIGTSDADRDRTKWGSWGNDNGNSTGGAAMRFHIDQIRNVYLPGRRTFLNTATIGGVAVPASQAANVAAGISLETVDFKPATNTQEHEFFVLRNANASSVDISGWQITGAVNWTFKPGTVLPPGGGATENLGDLYVVKNPYLFRQRASVPDDSLPAANQYRFVQGPYGGQLSARGETIELRDAFGTLLRTKTWTPAPTATQEQLRITELNYAPAGPTAAEALALPGVVESDFEFIELTNIGATPLVLTGAYFDRGITFTFPTFTLAAGARGLVVGNIAAFQLRHPGVNPELIAGQYDGSLDNNGENIQILDVTGENILDFTYSNSWFPPSDEGGRSLVLRSETTPWNSYDLPQSWGLSTAIGGTPGVADLDFATVYEGWRWEHFTAAEIPTGALPNLPAALLQDPDGDLRNNFAEYAYGRLPKTSDAGSTATVSIVNDGGSAYLALTYTRRHNALDVTYTVETTDNLSAGPWTPATTQIGSTIQLGNGVEQLTIRDSVPRGGPPRFIRARAEKP